MSWDKATVERGTGNNDMDILLKSARDKTWNR
jgi:hypothetical protein